MEISQDRVVACVKEKNMKTAANALSLPPAWYSRKADTQTTRPSVGKRVRGMLSNPPSRVTPYHVLHNYFNNPLVEFIMS